MTKRQLLNHCIGFANQQAHAEREQARRAEIDEDFVTAACCHWAVASLLGVVQDIANLRDHECPPKTNLPPLGSKALVALAAANSRSQRRRIRCQAGLPPVEE